MLQTGAHFYSIRSTALYRFVRLPTLFERLVVFCPPLFEDANNTRHAYSKFAQQLEVQQIASVIFDYTGTGDSAGELTDASIATWRLELTEQISDIKQQFPNVRITLLACCSAALVLNETLFECAHDIVFWHPELNGKKYLNQLKRMAKLQPNDDQYIGEASTSLIAGYELSAGLLDELAAINTSLPINKKIFWGEFSMQMPVPVARNRLYQSVSQSAHFSLEVFQQAKFWQASELTLPIPLLKQTMQWLDDAT
ncbi:hypothetical protein Q4489_00720 [Thalassotalea sp. 1_MG-2023]|uniref:hypothetical protein n=1 Tax=Thalassotalea sp. 1_MG-2023 TaxID=3062680 RepID=UPI0026E24493|nr:hypothetical protein [Thalassotalea sp. 1_MG-2023]MDO6425511.1 hypothetical protein [Thalassotalea sp. 1_MG-2023]